MLPRRYYYYFIVILFIQMMQFLIADKDLYAQDTFSVQDTISNIDTLEIRNIASNDSLKIKETDSTDSNALIPSSVRISESGLDDVITTHAEDSMILNVKETRFFLYEKASAKYQDLEVRSGVLIYDQKNHLLTARPVFDSLGKIISTQEFEQDTEMIKYDSLKYNFKTQRALVLNARTQYGEGFVHSEKVKRNKDGTTFGAGNVYTTCNLPHPHFGIHAKKIKVIPEKMIASGPANLVIQDIPTPLFLPFGIFPVQKGQSSGFILPTYSAQERKGVGLMGIGYYFAINDYLGLTSTYDIYSKGSWGTFNTLEYSKRYQYNGRFGLNYSVTKYGESFDPDGSVSKDFRVRWDHQVDQRARPGSTFSASVDVGTSSYNMLNGYDINQQLDNQYTSSISYSKNWIGKPYSFSAALRHNQSTQTGLVNVTAPDINFSIGQFSPFQRKEMVGSPKWYEKIVVNYSFNFQNKINFYDSLLSEQGLNVTQNIDYGLRHNAQVQATYNIFKYVNWNISIPYTEFWNTKQLFKSYDPVNQKNDSTVNHGFFATREFGLSSSMSTRIYGMKIFAPDKKVKGIRHVMTPSLSFNYTPGFAQSPFNYLYENQWDESQNPHYESPYIQSPIGGPNSALPQGNIGFSLQNTLQIKLAGEDSTAKDRNISLIDGLGLNVGYNIFADSMNLSMVNLNFKTNIVNKVNLNASAVLDPYVYDENNRQTSVYRWNADQGFLGFRSSNISLSVSFAGKPVAERSMDSLTARQEELALLFRNNGIQKYHDFTIPWDFHISGGLGIHKLFEKATQTYRMGYSPNMMFNGSFNLTDRWKVAFNGGLEFTEFKDIRLGTTSINISRDLHCWQMNLNLVPFGFYRSFNFSINVKASVLQDLKLTRRKSFHDNY